MKDIGNIQLQSWMNDRLPDMLWAALIVGTFSRDQYLGIFRAISETAEKLRDTRVFLTHSDLAKISDSEFDLVMNAIISDDLARKSLAPLRLLNALPDLKHWLRWGQLSL